MTIYLNKYNVLQCILPLYLRFPLLIRRAEMNIPITLAWTPKPGQANHILEVFVYLYCLQMEDGCCAQETKLCWFNPFHLLQWHSKRMEEKNKGRWQKKKAELWLQLRQQGFSQSHDDYLCTLIFILCFPFWFVCGDFFPFVSFYFLLNISC